MTPAPIALELMPAQERILAELTSRRPFPRKIPPWRRATTLGPPAAMLVYPASRPSQAGPRADMPRLLEELWENP